MKVWRTRVHCKTYMSKNRTWLSSDRPGVFSNLSGKPSTRSPASPCPFTHSFIRCWLVLGRHHISSCMPRAAGRAKSLLTLKAYGMHNKLVLKMVSQQWLLATSCMSWHTVWILRAHCGCLHRGCCMKAYCGVRQTDNLSLYASQVRRAALVQLCFTSEVHEDDAWIL